MARLTCGVVLFALALALLPGCGSDPPPPSKPGAAAAPPPPSTPAPEQPAVDPNQPYASDQDIEVEGYKIRIPAGFTPSKDEKEGDGTVREWSRSTPQSSATVRLIVGPVSDVLDPAKIAATTAAEMKKLFKKVAYLEDDDAVLNSLSGRVQYYSGVNEEDKPEEGTWYGLRDKEHVIGMTVRRVGPDSEIPMLQLHAILRTFRRATEPEPPQMQEPEPTVQVLVNPLHAVAEKTVTEALKKAAGSANPEITAQQQNEGYQFTLKPLRAINKLSKQISFGKVTNVDLQQRVITVEADITKVPQDPEKVATDPKHPSYFGQNLKFLAGADAEKRRQAIERLLGPDVKVPDAQKSAFAKAMQARAFDTKEQADVRVRAMTAMVAIGGAFSVPLLCDLLKDKEQTVRQAAFQKLVDAKDERALEPIAKMFCEQADSRDAAKTFLLSAGPAAEEAIIKYAPTDKAENIKPVLELLKEIGTKKSSKYLAQLMKNRKIFSEIQNEVQAVGKEINKRKK